MNRNLWKTVRQHLNYVRNLYAILLAALLVCNVTPGIAFGKPHHCPKDEYTVFGPQKFERDRGKPETETATFSVPVGGPGFTLRIKNGDGHERHGVSSAEIELNGKDVLRHSQGHSSFNTIERKVSLETSNVLTVKLQGKPGSFLTIEITGKDSGPSQVAVPNVEGLTRAAAESAITFAGLSVGTVTLQYSDTVPVGNVVSQDPPSGTSLQQGTPVNLVISLGIESVTVPDVIGMTQAGAESAVTAASLTIGAITSLYDNSAPAGQVVSQSPGTGTSVPIGTAVSLVVSLGPATTVVPNVTGLTQSDAEAAILAGDLTVGAVTTTYSNTVASGMVISQNPVAGSSVQEGSVVSLVVSLGDAPPVIPPGPETIAPPVDGTVATTVAASTEFLYTGSDPIQTGVAPGTIEVKRAAVLRGQVTDRDGNPLSGVTVTILNHPEFGQTLTRADGMFDMAVNGGGYHTVNYRKDGYMPVQRQVNVPWNDFAWLSDVVMLPFDSQVTTIKLASSMPVQVARGSISSDADGTRQATLFFSQGTSAQMVMPDGTTQSLVSLNVRATEYTVGPNGPKAMPADLPSSSAYTYAVELSADEAIAAGATEVQFDKPVYFYVENFLNFPVGGIVPVGYYDRKKAAWIPSDNGRIVKIVSITGGLADLDTDGGGQAADATQLAALGINDAERQQLGTLYTAGRTLWRVPMSHFTPWDCNWPWMPPSDATAPQLPKPGQRSPVKDPCTKRGSIIECQNQTLGESLPITGTPFSLNYRSNRVPGRKTSQNLKIFLSGATVPSSLTGIVMELSCAGRTIKQNFSPSPNLTYDFVWDGTDVYGRKLNGVQKVTGRIGYKYGLVTYTTPDSLNNAFARIGGSPFSVLRTQAPEIIIWQDLEATVEYHDARSLTPGGWSFNIHHVYDAINNRLHQGDGWDRTVDYSSLGVVSTIAGTGACCLELKPPPIPGDGGPAISGNFYAPTGIKLGPDGSLFIADQYFIRKISPDGIITTIAGNGKYEFNGDGGPATAAGLTTSNGVNDVAVAPDESFYISTRSKSSIRRVGTDGIITTYAGNGQTGFGGDGGPAVSAVLNDPHGIVLGPDGSLYLADTGNHRIRKIGPDGIITTIAGTGSIGYSGDGGNARQAQLSTPIGIAIGDDGSIYFTDWNTHISWQGSDSVIRKISPEGIISTIATKNEIPTMSSPKGITVAPDGSIYVAHNPYVYRIAPNGYVTTVAGCGNKWADGSGIYCGSIPAGPLGLGTFEGDGHLPKWTYFYGAAGIAVAPDGSLIISEAGAYKIRKIASMPSSLISLSDFTIASEDGKQLYVFNGLGRHMRTLNTLTNATLYQFGYDGSGRLVSITDGDGNLTGIERDPSGNPTAIVAPHGQRTTLTVDSNGYINSVADPAGETFHMTYTTDGLLTSFSDPKNNSSQFSYDADGFLIRDQNAAGGFYDLSGSDTTNSTLVTLNTALNRTTTYLTEILFNGDMRSTITMPSGATSIQLFGAKGAVQYTEPDKTTITKTILPDLRFDMQAPLDTYLIKTPSGLTKTISKKRTISIADPLNLLSLASQTDTISFSGRNYTSVFNATTKQWTSTTPSGRQSLTLLDNLGRTLSFTADPTLTPVAFTYDAHGRLALISQGALKSTYSYDTLGRVASISDAAGNTVQYGYDLADRVTQLTLPSGRSYTFSFDANGNNTGITMPSGVVHSLGYTVINQAKNYTPPANPAYSWDYNLDQDWTGVLLPGGRRVDAGYDGGGRSTALVYPEAAIGYYYDDATNRIKNIVRTAGSVAEQTLSFTYDGALVTGESYVGVANGNFTYTYDNNFFLTQMQLASGSDSVVTPLTRDPDGLVTGFGPFTFTRQGPAGAVSQISDPGLNIAVTYDTLGRVASRTHTVSGKTVYAIQLNYDSRGNISQKVETVSGTSTTFEYEYDKDGQLVQVKKNGAAAEIFAYDVNGNRTSYDRPGEWKVAADFDGQDRIIGQGGVTYQFNADGQLTQRNSDPYQYSATGELLQATVAGETVIYSYDGTGRRIARTAGSGTRQYLYGNLNNPFQLTAQRDTTGVLSHYYYDENGLLFAFDKGAERYYVATDQVGTPMVVADATGNVIKQMEYDSFGKASFDSNPEFDIPVGFAGGISDSKTGLVRFGYRDYEPIVGRWTAKDPIFFAGGQGNLFGYVLNNPVNFTDPEGLEILLLGRQPFIFRYPGVTRPAPNQRFIPPRQIPKVTPPPRLRPQPLEPFNPLEPSWWGKLFAKLADLMGEFGFGSDATIYMDPFNVPCEI